MDQTYVTVISEGQRMTSDIISNRRDVAYRRLSQQDDVSPPGVGDREVGNGDLRRHNGISATVAGSVDAGWREVATRWFLKVVAILLTNPVMSAVIITLVVAFSLSAGLCAIFVVTPSPVIEKSIKAFSVPDHLVSHRQDAFEKAQEDLANGVNGRSRRFAEDSSLAPAFRDRSMRWGNFGGRRNLNFERFPPPRISRRIRRNVSRRRRSAPFSQYIRGWKVNLVYLAVGNGDNIFTEERIQTIHDVEKKVATLPEYSGFCYKSYLKNVDECVPPNSLMTYFYPSILSDGTVVSDGLGNDMISIDDALANAMNHNGYWYTDGSMVKTNEMKSKLLRTELSFGVPLPGWFYRVVGGCNTILFYEILIYVRGV